MSLPDAINDLRDSLYRGELSLDEAVEDVARDYGLSPVFLRNRATAVLGDLSTCGERYAELMAGERERMAENRRKAALGRVRERLAAHNSRQCVLTPSELSELCELGNSLGGSFVIKHVRAPRRTRLDFTWAEIEALLERIFA